MRADRHADLRATYAPGQRWETQVDGQPNWAPVTGEPLWDQNQAYRRRADPPMEQGGDMHLSLLMARYNLNFVVGAERAALLAWGRDVWKAALASQAQAQAAEPEPTPPWVRNDESTRDALLLIDLMDVPLPDIALWTDQQCQQAEDYATALHFSASDNNNTVPAMPEHLKRYEWQPGDPNRYLHLAQTAHSLDTSENDATP